MLQKVLGDIYERDLENLRSEIESYSSEEDIWKVADGITNPAGNLCLHLCGNLGQWVASAIGGRPDTRDRKAEFAERRALPKRELIAQLRRTVAEADAALAACPVRELVQPIRVQGFDTTKLAAIFDSVSHFVGHTHQIVYITRLRLGDRYRFQWSPATKEQGA